MRAINLIYSLQFATALLLAAGAAPLAHAQYAGHSRAPSTAPSVELNLDVLSKLRGVPVASAPNGEIRKVPRDQPYAPPVALPADGMAPAAVGIAAAPLSTGSPFARGESPSHILSEASSAAPPAPERRTALATAPRRTVRASKPAAPPAPKEIAAPKVKETVVAEAPPPPVVTPPPPAPVTESAPPKISTAPMMIPVKKPLPPLPAVVKAPEQAPVAKAPEPIAPAIPAPAAVVSQEPKAPPALPTPSSVEVAKLTPPSSAMPAPAPMPPLPKLPPLAQPQISDLDQTPELPKKLPDIDVLIKAPDTPPPPPPAALPAVSAPIPKPAAVTVPSVPPAPSLAGLDFSGMKAPKPAGELEGLSPQQLLGKPVETMVVKKAATVPEIEVPANMTTPNEPPKMLPSISARMEKMFTKEPSAQGTLKDETRTINPVADALPKVTRGEEKALAKSVDKPATKPETMPPATLPPLPEPSESPLAITPMVKKAPPMPPPPPAAIVQAPKQVRPKPDISEKTVIASLPPLPAAKLPDTKPALAPALPVLPPPSALPKPPAKVEKAPEKKLPAPAAAPKPAPQTPAPAPTSGAMGSKAATISFASDATELSAAAKAELVALSKTMKEKGSAVRITAYAKGTPDEASIARRISMSRALAVRAFLIREGVDQLKINVQAMGHNVPSGAPDRADVMIR